MATRLSPCTVAATANSGPPGWGSPWPTSRQLAGKSPPAAGRCGVARQSDRANRSSWRTLPIRRATASSWRRKPRKAGSVFGFESARRLHLLGPILKALLGIPGTPLFVPTRGPCTKRRHHVGGYVNRCVNDIRRRPSQPLIQWRFHPHTVHRDRRLRSTQGPSDA